MFDKKETNIVTSPHLSLGISGDPFFRIAIMGGPRHDDLPPINQALAGGRAVEGFFPLQLLASFIRCAFSLAAAHNALIPHTRGGCG